MTMTTRQTAHRALGLILICSILFGSNSAYAQPNFKGFIRPLGTNPESDVPDSEIAVGPNHVVGITNDEIGYFDFNGNTLHKRMVWFGLPPDKGFFEVSTSWMADPEVMYDTDANRYWATMFANFLPGFPNNGASLVIAVSDDGDPTGLLDPVPTSEGVWRKWYFVDPAFSAFQLIDSPNLAVDQSWVYVEGVLRDLNVNGGNTDIRHRMWVWPKAALMNTVTNPPPFNLATTPGVPAPKIYEFPLGTPYLNTTGLVQKYTYDSSPQFTLASRDGSNQNKIEIRAFRFIAGSATPTVTMHELTVPAGYEYSQPALAPQPGTGADPFLIFDSRFWGTPVYRNGSIWACQTITPGSGPAINQVQWLEIKTNGWPDTIGVVPTVHQIGKISSPDRHYHFPSIAVNHFGDACITYSESSTTIYPTMRRAMRKASDTLGTLPNDQAVYASTSTWEFNPSTGPERWGDYSGTDTSKTNRCEFWGTHEYYADDTTNPPGPVNDDRYRVRIVKYNVCQSDFDGNGQIEAIDILAFQDLYAAGDEQADVTEDAQLSIEDQILATDLITKGLP